MSGEEVSTVEIFIQRENGYEDKAVALDHFAQGWIEERKETNEKEEKI